MLRARTRETRRQVTVAQGQPSTSPEPCDILHIQPPQPRRSTGYGSRRSPLGFSRNVRLEIAAPNLVVRVRIIRGFTDNPGPHRGQPDPDEPIAPAQRGPARRPLVHGERLAQGEVLESELVVAAVEGREESGGAGG